MVSKVVCEWSGWVWWNHVDGVIVDAQNSVKHNHDRSGRAPLLCRLADATCLRVSDLGVNREIQQTGRA
jgi:hypothetical protein